MKRLLLCLTIMGALEGSAVHAFPPSTHATASADQIPALEMPDDYDEDDQELLDTTVVVEPPLYLRVIRTVGGETTAVMIRVQRAILARWKEFIQWLGVS